MPKFTFTCEHEHPIKKDVAVSTITYESKRECLPDILDDFRDFLKGCGFYVDGDIDIVKQEEYPHEDIIISCSGVEEHNDYYYDIGRNR